MWWMCYVFDGGDLLELGEDVVGDRSGGGRVAALGLAADGSGHAGAGDHTRRPHRQFILYNFNFNFNIIIIIIIIRYKKI